MDSDFKVDFIGIGAPRCGTTWLYKCLSEHPDICMSKPKELNYFATDSVFTLSKKLTDHWYESRFNHCKLFHLKGEISPSYLRNETAAISIRKYFPACKIIVQLRHPTEALYSLFRYFANEPTFERFIENYPELVDQYLYTKHLQRFLTCFGKKNVHCIFFDDIVASPIQVLHSLFDFLGVAQMQPKFVHVKVNAKSKFALCGYGKIFFGLRKRLAPHSWIVRTFPTQLLFIHSLIEKILERLPRRNSITNIPMQQKTRMQLIEFFRSSNDELAQLLGKDLTSWNR
ncbi:MAG: sulfotransferase [Candidatus Peribacteraceae bacterium]|nr:sulfotransferase [Candidatus Peribacteraceae bacterium]